jgi:hypothetical protein
VAPWASWSLTSAFMYIMSIVESDISIHVHHEHLGVRHQHSCTSWASWSLTSAFIYISWRDNDHTSTA